MAQDNSTIHYYVDESGDFNLFTKKGKPAVIIEGVSQTIMLGSLRIKDENFIESFSILRNQILSDTILQSIPSFKKTQEQFHAKSDHIAVKREVFNYIATLDCSVQVIIRRKSTLVEQAKMQFEYTQNKVTDSQLYGDLATRLFKRNIHKADCYDIYFSERGKTFASHTLEVALRHARKEFIEANNISTNSSFRVFCVQPSRHFELQIIDYCLWALQRMYEQKEDVYFNIIKDKFSFILDIDDKRDSSAGRHYCKKDQASLDKISGIG